MKPTIDQVRRTAFERWERRGRVHGFDRADWLAAERQQRFSANYRVVAADRLDSEAPRAIGDASRRRCRYCGQAAPRTAFSHPTPVVPLIFGPGSPIAFDQCDDCSAMFGRGIDEAFSRFAASFLANSPAETAGIAVDAFKGLVKLAIAIMPSRDLEDHEDTLEWIGNPDHDFDLNVFRGLSCAVHVSPVTYPSSWVALAKRTDDDEPWPSMLFFLGTGHIVFQVPIPLSQRDEDFEDATSTVPDVSPPAPFGHEHEPIARVLLPLVPTAQMANLSHAR